MDDQLRVQRARRYCSLERTNIRNERQKAIRRKETNVSVGAGTGREEQGGKG